MPNTCGKTAGGAWQKLGKKPSVFAQLILGYLGLGKSRDVFTHAKHSFSCSLYSVKNLIFPLLSHYFYSFSNELCINITRFN